MSGRPRPKGGRPSHTGFVKSKARSEPQRPTSSPDLSSHRIYSLSGDGRRTTTLATTHHIEKRRRILPNQMEDEYAGFNPETLYTFGEDPGAPVQTSVRGVEVQQTLHLIGRGSTSGMPAAERSSGANGEAQDEEEDEDEVVPVVGQKRKHYDSSDAPMTKWRPKAPEYLREMFWIDGGPSNCMDCSASLSSVASSPGPNHHMVRCIDCERHVLCPACCLKAHQRLPLHKIQEWTGDFWKDSSLCTLGLIYQLGHDGLHCDSPKPNVHSLVGVDIWDVHTISYRDCGCRIFHPPQRWQHLLRNGWYPATSTEPKSCATFRTLDLYRSLYVVANTNVNDFIHAIERLADPSDMERRPERGRTFMRMTRQYTFLKRAKRVGRAHSPSGLEGTKQGELATQCWACPHDGINLPPDWRDVTPKLAFLYTLFLCMDANFKLKNKFRKNERDTVELAPGWGCFVEQSTYKEHLRNYINETDVSTCSAFAAIAQKDTRNTSGLRVSGVGGVFCARHGVCRPRGLGDLHKGERYSSMDFIFASGCLFAVVLRIFVAYDIACQWARLLWTRMEHLPDNVKLKKDDVEVDTGVGVFHSDGHVQECKEETVVTHQEGTAITDGEEAEREWAVMNPCSYATREMGEESRRNFIEDKLDYMGHRKNVGQVETLPRRLFIAREERAIQLKNFQELNESLTPQLRQEWTKMLVDWNADHSKPNPFLIQNKDAAPNEYKIRAELAKEELEDVRAGRVVSRAVTASTFLILALGIEDSQRRLRFDAAIKTADAPNRVSKLDERRHGLNVRLKRMRRLQDVFTPIATVLADKEAQRVAAGEVSPTVGEENMKLWLPSEVPAALRRSGCIDGMVEKERRLREAQARDSLDTVRRMLYMKGRLIRFRNANVSGQREGMKSNTLIQSVSEKVRLHAERYRTARSALIALDGNTDSWRELKDDDLTLNVTMADDDDSRRRMAAAVTAEHAPARTSAIRQTVSWIWGANAGASNDSPEMHEMVRVEWAKSRVRRDRWSEEVQLLSEEMRRVLRYLHKFGAIWSSRAETCASTPGLKAYAKKQAYLYTERERRLKAKWSGNVKVGRDKSGKDKILAAGTACLEEPPASEESQHIL